MGGFVMFSSGIPNFGQNVYYWIVHRVYYTFNLLIQMQKVYVQRLYIRKCSTSTVIHAITYYKKFLINKIPSFRIIEKLKGKVCTVMTSDSTL